jgi:arylsulfatase B
VNTWSRLTDEVTNPNDYDRIMKKAIIACLGLMISATPDLSLKAAEKTPPNIILIIADDLGYGDLGAYGCRDIQTPRLDRLAEEGIRLTQGYVSAPYCGPSRAGLMTGRYQQRHGFYNNPPYRPDNLSLGLDTGEETIADVLDRAGYRTAAFGKWHMGAAAPFHPNNRGFDEFCGFRGGGHNYFPARYPEIRDRLADSRHPSVNGPEIYQYATPLEFNGVDLAPQEFYLTDILTDYAFDFISRYISRPFFVYLAYNAPHTPLEAPDGDIALYTRIEDPKRRIYAAMVTNLDRNVGRLLDHLRDGDWKMVRKTEDGPWNLSDLAGDMGEETNHAGDQSKRVRTMGSVFQDWYSSLAPKRWEDPNRN